jgi:hypothetical protein
MICLDVGRAYADLKDMFRCFVANLDEPKALGAVLDHF